MLEQKIKRQQKLGDNFTQLSKSNSFSNMRNANPIYDERSPLEKDVTQLVNKKSKSPD